MEESLVRAVPGRKCGAIIVGAEYGKGYISRRRRGVPAGLPLGQFRLREEVAGLQIGGSEIDIDLLVMTERGVDRLPSSQFTPGAAASVAEGPVGRSTRAATDSLMSIKNFLAESLWEVATLRQDASDNRHLYGRTLENREILEKEMPVPKPARKLISLLNKHSVRK